MSVSAEVRVNRRNTAAMIAANASCIALIPVVKTKGPNGYTSVDGDPRPEQFFRVIDQSTTYGNIPGKLRSSEGQERKITHQLLGYYDCTMELGDYWVDDLGARYEIDEVLPYNRYEQRAKVIRYGKQ